MPKKGVSNNPAGKPKGTLSAKTRAWEELGESIINEGADRFKEVMNGYEDEDFIKAYLLILEYFKPKQQRREVESKQTLTVNWEEDKTYIPDDNSDIA